MRRGKAPIDDGDVQLSCDEMMAKFPGCAVVLVVAKLNRNSEVTDLSCVTNAQPDDVNNVLKNVTRTYDKSKLN